jgi:hypothetical protein
VTALTAHTCTATVLGPRSGGDRAIPFVVAEDPTGMAADDLVEAFMAELHRTGELPAGNGYELNAAIRKPEHRVVLAIGHLRLGREELPLAVMIAY